MVTVSRRTPPALTAIVRAALAPRPHLLYDGTRRQPLPRLPGAADAVVVTADSVNMVGEAAATGAPVLRVRALRRQPQDPPLPRTASPATAR